MGSSLVGKEYWHWFSLRVVLRVVLSARAYDTIGGKLYGGVVGAE